jgi:hypothetical protein
MCERWLVTLVVTVATIAEYIDDDVTAELLSEVEGEVRYMYNRFRIVAINVKYGNRDNFSDVSWEER